MLRSKRARAIDRSDHLIEEIKTDDKAAMQRVIIEEWKRERETSLCGPATARSNDAPELISLLVPLALPSANYAVFIIAETSKQNVTFGHGSMAGGRSGGPPQRRIYF